MSSYFIPDIELNVKENYEIDLLDYKAPNTAFAMGCYLSLHTGVGKISFAVAYSSGHSVRYFPLCT